MARWRGRTGLAGEWTTTVPVAGDALGNTSGITGSNPQLTVGSSVAPESVKQLDNFHPGVILLGHGDQFTSGAADALRTYAASLQTRILGRKEARWDATSSR